ncbi:MAG: anthranilate phosphoribosyltransferase [Planctomycetaceae bacterium]|jgi:anthranilate phosphoribosyltransferase|nr:anthranilate phosphoribosyltransferase [Planctomycetaceae bacterium]
MTEIEVRQKVVQALQKLSLRQNLTEQETFELFCYEFEGKLSEVQLAGLVVGLAVKGETFEELAGAGRSLRTYAHKIRITGSPIVDIIGTGNDVQRTFNVSTIASIVVAGAGCTVAKHGCMLVRDACSSADVLESCGYNMTATPEKVEECIAKVGLGFMLSSVFQSGLHNVNKVSVDLGIRTIFNMLAPLGNPAGADSMVVGVFSGELTEKFAAALRNLGVKAALVVYGHDGMDEISISAPTRITELCDGKIRSYNIRPEMYFKGAEPVSPQDLAGGTQEENAQTLRGILNGQIQGVKRNIVLINAAAGLYVAGKVNDLHEGIDMARYVIDNGLAYKKFEQMIEFMKKT